MGQIDNPESHRANLDYIRTSMREPLLTRNHELDLAIRWRQQGDEKALHELVRSYTRLVISMAGRFRSYGLPMADLVQEGNVGLMQAAGRFEPERDVRFSTYASWWIRASMQDFILRNWSIVRTGTTAAQKSLFFNMRRLRAKIEADNESASLTQQGREKIATELGVSIADVTMMEQRLSGGDRSLNAVVGEEGDDSWQDFLADDRPTPEEAVMDHYDTSTRLGWLDDALDRLNPRERHIIQQRRLKEDGVTLEALGREMGVSKERVRQLENRALEKLRTFLTPHASQLQNWTYETA